MVFGILFLLAPFASALPVKLGDFDEDGEATVLDIIRLMNHLKGTPTLAADLVPFGDLNQDGIVNDADVTLLRDAILFGTPLPGLPLARVHETSPSAGEGNVSVNRETILRFSQPLSTNAMVGTNHFYATFGGRRILSRSELSSDRKTITLFYLEPLPASARVRVTFSPGTDLRDFLLRELDADGDGIAGGSKLIDFDTASITPVMGTAVIGWVYASQLVPGGTNTTNFINLPLANVQITVDGAEQNLRTTTSSNGFFALTNCPAGRFFVHVDGRTAVGSQWPGGAYYPVVGKAWEARAGYTSNLAGGSGLIYLPLIAGDTLQTISPTNDTMITFPPSVLASNPALAGVNLMVPPNSLFSDAGTRGGKVGLAPVPPDRLPEPLPPGLRLPLVITVQTDGPQNFDMPIPARFPNLPDPVTGVKLPPGAKSALWSFNHDTGRWEIQGSMTVTADGNFVESDPGVGIRQPGWHGTQAGTQGRGSPPPLAPGQPPPPTVCASGWDIAKLIYDIARDSYDCAKDLLKIKQAIQCGVSVVRTTTDLIRTAADVIASIKKHETGAEQLKTWLASVRALKDRIVMLEENCVKAVDPVEKLKTIINCIGSLLGVANTVCGIQQAGEEQNPNQPACQRSTFTKTVCKGVEQAKLLQVTAANYLNLAEATKKKFAATAVCAAMAELEATIGAILAARSNSVAGLAATASLGDALTDAEIALLVQNFAAVNRTANDYVAAGINFQTLGTGMERLEASLNDSLGVASDGLNVKGSPINRPLYYVITNDFFVFRGVTSPQGAIDRILPPDTDYFLAYYDPIGKLYGEVNGLTGPNGSVTKLHAVLLEDASSLPDADADGLPDKAELILGTNPNNRDTDNDGVSDGAEAQQGSDPLSGQVVQTGIVGSAAIPNGNAVDVCAINNLAIVAASGPGVVVFDVTGVNPVRIASVDTPGAAQRVACSGNLIAVADGFSGLAIVDITDPPAARITQQISFGVTAQAVAVAGNVAYVGLSSGQLVSIDMTTGAELSRTNVGASIEDVAVGRDHLYVLTGATLHTVSLLTSSMQVVNSTASPTGSNRRLFVGDRYLYATQNKGVNAYSLANAAQPSLVSTANTAQFGWKQFIPTGSRFAMAVVNPNSTSDGPNDVSLYDLVNPTNTQAIVTTFVTPGSANAASIYNGLAYVADGLSGLQVINYLAFDAGGVPPAITLTNSFVMNGATNGGPVEEGKPVRTTALVTDDVQVRNVEFYVDGVRQVIDGNFVFEHRFLAPSILPGKTNFTLQAKATDTGGNVTWSPLIKVALGPDLTPPRVLETLPKNTSVPLGSLIRVRFSEPIDVSTINSNSVRVTNAGLDQMFGTLDDQVFVPTVSSYDPLESVAWLALPTNARAGSYTARIGPPLADLIAIPMNTTTNWQFTLYSVGTITGRFLATNGQSIAGAMVRATTGGNTFITTVGADGTFTLNNVQAEVGPISLSVSFVANQILYRALLSGLLLNADQTLVLGDVFLQQAKVTPQLVSCGYGSSFALKQDGSLWAWGLNGGQFGDGSVTNRPVPGQVATNKSWASVVESAGGHTLAIATDGTLWAWGNNGSGQLGDGTSTFRYLPVPVATNKLWRAIAAGSAHSVALATDDTLWTWGSDNFGTLGDGTNASPPFTLIQIGTNKTWQAIGSGSLHSLAVATDGTLWTWGYNIWGQLGDGTTTGRTAPVQIGSNRTWAAVAAGDIHSMAISTDGTLWGWGANYTFGQLGEGTFVNNRLLPVKVGTNKTWATVTANSTRTFGIATDGTLWGWGRNTDGELGDGTFVHRNLPTQIGSNLTWSAVATGLEHTLALSTDGRLWSMGNTNYGELGLPERGIRPRPAPTLAPPAAMISAGGSHAFALTTNGALWGWGLSDFGQVGDGTNFNRSTPRPIGTNRLWALVEAGVNHTHAITTTNSLWSWGKGSDWQLGTGNGNNQMLPVPVGTNRLWLKASGGERHGVAIATNTLWGWGLNSSGSIGDGTISPRLSPSPTATNKTWSTVSAGFSHTLAIATDSTLWAWGINGNFQLGDGTLTNRLSPVQVGTNKSSWASVAAGRYHSLAIATDGTLWAWGFNGSGRLGDGTLTDRSLPVPIGTNKTWLSVSAGQDHSAAVAIDGTLWTWGYNSVGQLGDGTFTDRLLPVQIGTNQTWTAVSAGNVMTTALAADGTVWAWGSNVSGELGDGRAPFNPATVDDNTNWGGPP